MRAYFKLATIPRSQEDEESLEFWGDDMCKDSLGEELSVVQNQKQQILLEWMLRNIPTIGLFCNEEGNVRLNVLSGRIHPSIYMNKNFKCGVLDRMMKKAQEDQIKRFSTVAWQGCESIALKELPFSAFFVKRGLISDYSYYKTIVPLEGALLQKWKVVLDSRGQRGLERKLAILLKDMDIVAYLREVEQSNDDEVSGIRDYLHNRQRNITFEIAMDFLSAITSMIELSNYKKESDVQQLLKEDADRREGWRRLYRGIVQIHMLENSRDTNAQEEAKALWSRMLASNDMRLLCDAWLYCCIYKDEMIQSESQVKRCYDDYQSQCNSNGQEERVIAYIQERHDYCLNADLIRNSLNDFREELLGLAMRIEMQKINSYLEENKRKHRMVVERILDGYKKQKETEVIH